MFRLSFFRVYPYGHTRYRPVRREKLSSSIQITPFPRNSRRCFKVIMLITRNILQDSVIENTASRSSRASEGSRHAHFRDTPRGRVSVCARAPVWRTSPTSCLWPAQLRRRNSSFLFRASRCPRRVLILTVVAYTFSLLIQRNGQSFHSNDFQVKA